MLKLILYNKRINNILFIYNNIIQISLNVGNVFSFVTQKEYEIKIAASLPPRIGSFIPIEEPCFSSIQRESGYMHYHMSKPILPISTM